ncbi:MAG: RdgB/HAM1 family non-canonical purine NTP pyrophosphatase, partial [Clostridiales bacterium]|nr:RdgB/HAM1 family non-canonical purine NTP pyrophosphatase [Clostridiales bacterium]
MKLIAASNNKGKIKELKQILSPFGYEVISQSEAGIDIDVEETGKSFEENAALKARAISKITGLPTIADDSGLSVDYLDGAPGIFSARFAGENATDKENNDKLLKMLSDVPISKRDAKFICAICFISEDGENISVQGQCSGEIGFSPVGKFGFGYDPIFMVGD